jgi:hypothetical protein
MSRRDWMLPVFGLLLFAAARYVESSESPSKDAPAGAAVHAALEGPLAGIEEIVFAVRRPAPYHYYENFGHYLFPRHLYPLPPPGESAPGPRLFGDGARLCRLNLRTGEVTVLLDDPAGGVRDPQVHYDGRKILFSYRKGGQPYYHLYEIGVDGSGLAQLTGGPFDDIEPTYAPDGGILFCSTRCRRFVGCNPSPVATLFRCEADGSGVREISPSPFTDNTPWMLPDGRVIYTRWEYVDRNQMSFHHLWAANPDGTGQMAYYGNQYQGRGEPPPRFSDVAMLGAKPIPGTRKIVASFSPSHGRGDHMGYVTVVDPALGPDALESAQRVNSQRLFRDPYPLSEDCFLAADAEGIWLMDGEGRTERLFALPAADRGLECFEPRPLASRPREPVLPSRVDLSRRTGVLALADVYRGRNMAGVRRGEITQLLVMEQLPKPVQFSGGQEPLTIGGTFTLHRILGTVPVEPDGSALFELPAGRPLFFAALDAEGLSVKRMQSFLSVQPGETTGCVGCHEPRTQSLPARPSWQAGDRAPVAIRPIAGLPEVFDYPRDIQPILDRHCVSCHHPRRRDGGVELTGDHTPLYSVSYWVMITHGLISDGRNYQGDQPPRTVGSSASRLLELGDGSHHGAAFSPRERTMVRLWIESGATYPGTYAALGTGMATVEFPAETFARRCGQCHARQDVPAYAGRSQGDLFQFGPWEPPQAMVGSFHDFNMVVRLAYLKFGEAPPHQALCNLTHPEHSLILRAPLPAEAGGLGLCGDVFGGRDDADYREILAAIEDAAERLARHKRFDMPGFRPSPYYVRQLQEYGILPRDLSPEAALDVYALDRQYWRSLWPDP